MCILHYIIKAKAAEKINEPNMLGIREYIHRGPVYMFVFLYPHISQLKARGIYNAAAEVYKPSTTWHKGGQSNITLVLLTCVLEGLYRSWDRMKATHSYSIYQVSSEIYIRGYPPTWCTRCNMLPS